MGEHPEVLHELAAEAKRNGDEELAREYSSRAIQAEMMLAHQLVYGGQWLA